MGSILTRCKKLKKLYGPSLEYWQQGDYCPGLWGWIGCILLSPPPKKNNKYYSLGIGLTLFKSIGHNVQLCASAKVRDTQYCKLGAKVLKSFCAPMGGLNGHTKRGREEKLGRGVMDSPRTHIQVRINLWMSMPLSMSMSMSVSIYLPMSSFMFMQYEHKHEH
jgi:hypothetical protein